MRHLGLLLVAIVLAVAFACDKFAPTYPPPPCGYRGIACGDGYCCSEGEWCGSTQTPWCDDPRYCCAGEIVGGKRAQRRPATLPVTK